MTLPRPGRRGLSARLAGGAYAWGQRLLGLALIVTTLIAARDLPAVGDKVFVGAAVYLLALVRLPRLWLLVLPVFCITVDLAPRTGRFLYSELDVVFWLTIAAALICARFRAPSWQDLSTSQRAGMILVAAFVLGAIAVTDGLGAIWRPPAELDGNPYLDPRYGYKVIKGLLWAAALLPLWLQLRRENPERTHALLAAGASLAALALLLVVLRERGTLAAFAVGLDAGLASLADLTTAYRTTGLFSDMHTGGEAIDGTILLLLVINACAAISARRAASAFPAGVAVLALVYVTLVGFTRSTYAAVAVALSLIVALEVFRRSAVLALRPTRAVALAGLLPVFFLCSYLAAVAGGAGLLLPVAALELLVLFALLSAWLPGLTARRPLLLAALLVPQLFALGLTAGTMGGRMLGVERDLDTRLEHWSKVVELATRQPGSRLLGAGAGAFPSSYHREFTTSVDWIGSFEVERQPPRLLLGGGGDLHVYQRLRDGDGNEDLHVVVSARARAGGVLALSLCARNILDTGGWRNRCDTQRLWLPRGDGFALRSVTLRLPLAGRSDEAAGWPRSLHLRSLRVGQSVEVERLAVLRGSEALRNGGFRDGTDSWFFTTGIGHLPYHVKNLWLQLWFDHGWLGLVLVVLMFVLLARRALAAPPAQRFLPMAATAVFAMGALGVFASPLDSARVSWLFFLLLFAGLTEPARIAQPLSFDARRAGGGR